ncbi:MAG: hypothetical protein JKY52_01860 [Flavobacteriales bacterium]|nr:hypothetical protein [Flavobacteriales bacterium]
MRFFVLFGILAIAATSCTHVNVDKEVALIDSLKTAIKNAEITLEKVDIDKISTLKEQMGNQIALIKDIYGDSIKWEYAKTLSQYHRIQKSFTKFADKQAYIKGEITFSHQQLADLTAVLKNNIIHTDSFQVHFAKECQAAEDLKDIIQVEVKKAQNNLELYKKFSPKVKAMLKDQNSDGEV